MGYLAKKFVCSRSKLVFWEKETSRVLRSSSATLLSIWTRCYRCRNSCRCCCCCCCCCCCHRCISKSMIYWVSIWEEINAACWEGRWLNLWGKDILKKRWKKHNLNRYFLKDGRPFLVSFSLLLSFLLYNWWKNFANVWIRTADLWCQKRPLHQLSLNRCPI